jgi:hypothetical protein
MIGAAILLAGTAPVVVYESAIVTNDAASTMAAGLVLFFAALAWRRPGWWTAPTLFVVGAVVTSFKTTDILPVAAVALAFGIMTWTDRVQEAAPRQLLRGVARSWLPTGGALLIGGAASAAAWVVVSQSLSLVDLRTFAVFDILRVHPVDLGLIAREALTLLAPATGSFDPLRVQQAAQSGNLEIIADTLLMYLLVAGGLAGLFVRRRQWFHWLGLLSVPLLYIGGVALGASVWHTYNTDPGLSGRYGMSLVPFLALALCAACRGRWLLGSIWLFGLASVGLSLYFTLVP